MEEQALELAFQDWLVGLSKSEKKNLLPNIVLTQSMEINQLRKYFIENFWDKIKKEIPLI